MNTGKKAKGKARQSNAAVEKTYTHTDCEKKEGKKKTEMKRKKEIHLNERGIQERKRKIVRQTLTTIGPARTSSFIQFCV